MQNTKKQIILTILDGWGYSALTKGNTIAQANTPFYKQAWGNFPHTLLEASAESVGLRWGELGGSQVGHMTIGTGRVIPGFLTSISSAINDKSFFDNPALKGIIIQAQTKQKAIHVAGLMSAGGIHSHIEHLEAIFILLKKMKFNGPVFIHCITDGRDTPAEIATIYVKKIQQWIKQYGIWGRIASISGRYYAMDRDQRWSRTALAYNAMVGDPSSPTTISPIDAINNAYKQKQNDEFIIPTIVTQYANIPAPNGIFGPKYYGSLKDGAIKEGDGVIFLNFRPDRMRQIVQFFLLPAPNNIKINQIKNVEIATMTEYSSFFDVKVAFQKPPTTNTLSDVLADKGLNQLHIAETEKYAHLTYFFNAEDSDRHKGEDWSIVPSPKVETYDTNPNMSAPEITNELLKITKNKFYNFIAINYANADMVGHTGDYSATIKAVECVDQQLSTIATNFPEAIIIITGDHGNAEQMIDPKTGGIDKEHSLNPVPLVVINQKLKLTQAEENINISGILADIAPTILDLFGFEKPAEMTGISLLPSLNIDPRKL